ncbi:MAG TPA: cytochrome c biogenesis protein CcsA [bacterium]|nr:cytochrome c biogenesis protein CcsA [bacterium]
MTFGNILINALFWLNIAGFGFYLISIGSSRNWKLAGRTVQWLKVSIATVGVFYLGTLFVHDQFGFKYVYENSASAQEFLYKISGIWAGQEGTFLLWLLMLAVVNLVLAYTIRDLEDWTMIFAAVMEIMLCILLLKRSPFELMPGAVSDGLGMNVLLKNPWMVIHPPIVFAGYALAEAPFVIFLASMARGDKTAWTRLARPWAVFSWGILGIGIFLGSYWAYEVLGWGGYWGWDPVENASLFPWIVMGGLVHGLFLQAYHKRYIFWNAFMAVVAYLMVFYSTFLTRSGVLSNFSVHSFTGLDLYLPLMMSLGFIALIGISMLVVQAKRLPAEAEQSKNSKTRSALLNATIYCFWIFFGFVFLGTDWPIISSYIAENPSTVPGRFYNLTSLMVGIPLNLIMFVCPVIFGGGKEKPFSVGDLVAGVFAGAFSTIVCVFLGVKNVAALVFVFSAGAALMTNALQLGRHLLSGRLSFASYLAHAGVALLLFGIIASSLGSKTERFVMVPGGSKDFQGYNITLSGVREYEFGHRAFLTIEGKKSLTARMEFVAEQAQRMAVNKPFISRFLTGDLYLTPIQVFRSGGDSEEEKYLRIGQGRFDMAEDVKVYFDGYDLEKMQQGTVGIVIRAETGEKKEKFTIYYGPGQDGMFSRETQMKERAIAFEVVSIDPDSKEIILRWRNVSEKEKEEMTPVQTGVVFQASVKPYVNLFWLGIILMSTGALIASARRFVNNRKNIN